MLPSVLWAGLVDDAALVGPGGADVGEAVLNHREFRSAWFAPMVGPLVVTDQRLAEIGRAWGHVAASAEQDAPAELAVRVVNTTGAGGLVSLAGRTVPGVVVVAVESALRDLDDLSGNAARVLSAASELGDDVDVFVEIPYAPGWERAVAEVEAAGRYAAIRPDELARQLSVLVEADCPFTVAGGLPRPGVLHLLAAVEVLVEGATEAAVAEVLVGPEREVLAERIGSWDELHSARVRRRLRSVACRNVPDAVQELVALGLLEVPRWTSPRSPSPG